MKILKIFFFLVVLILITIISELKFHFLPKKYGDMLNQVVNNIFASDNKLVEMVSSSNIEISTLKERGSEISSQAQSAFAKAVEPSEEEKPLHDRAFEYGRYLYCKEVIKSYEEKK